MNSFSGVFFRIWGQCGPILILGIVCILLAKPWAKGFTIQKCKIGLITVAFAIVLCFFYASRIVFPNVTSYTGVFVRERLSPKRVAPVTNEYVFWNGEGEKRGFYLDIYSKKEIFPYEFTGDQMYTIYFDKLTRIITRVEIVETTHP